MFFSFLLLLAVASDLTLARNGHGSHRRSTPDVRHGMFPVRLTKSSSGQGYHTAINRRQASASAGCGAGSQLTIKAPKTNIFAGLTDVEAAAVTSFLHSQRSLNLTAAASATRQAFP